MKARKILVLSTKFKDNDTEYDDGYGILFYIGPDDESIEEQNENRCEISRGCQIERAKEDQIRYLK